MRVNPASAFQQATFHLALITSGHLQNGDFATWQNVSIGSMIKFSGFEYLDRDDPVIYLYEVIDSDNRVQGFVGICGSTYFGTTLAFIHVLESSSISDLLQKAKHALRSNSRTQEGDPHFVPVVYSYPKIGVAQYHDGNLIGLVDLFFDGILDIAAMPSISDNQGLAIWSFWDEYPQAGPSEDEWRYENDAIEKFLTSYFGSQPIIAPTVLGDEHERLKEGAIWTDNIRQQIVSDPPTSSSLILPVTIQGQKTDHHCAPTSLAMIFEYIYGIPLDQDEAGEAMELTIYGTSINNQERGFKAKFGDDFNIVVDKSPDFDELEAGLKEFLPVKSGVRGHARVATGVRRDYFIDPVSGKIAHENLLLRIHDPLPQEKGSIRWENVKAKQLRDFIFLRRR